MDGAYNVLMLSRTWSVGRLGGVGGKFSVPLPHPHAPVKISCRLHIHFQKVGTVVETERDTESLVLKLYEKILDRKEKEEER
mmetsp:Transcript_31641/g.62599  ORF Transcript_31641/g.62599 Transcript_31641/m.62599 type:complete len:82 (-) Transcript_31641:996-1241(-)